MIELIIYYLWHDAHTSSKIAESLIKILCANQTGDSWNAGITHLIWKAIKNGCTTLFCNEEIVRLGYRSLLVENVLQILCIGWNLHGVKHWDVDIHLPDHIHEATKLFILHELLHLVRKRQHMCITNILGRSFPKVNSFLFRPRYCLNVGLSFTSLFI
jgi:hypothetical protein